MNEGPHVYELDTEELIVTLQDRLAERGYDVREQVPAGVSWIVTDKSHDEAAAEISELLRVLIFERLRSVER